MDRQAYIREAERFFALLRAGGFALSHDDLGQVEDAFRKGVPLEGLLAGLTAGVRAFLHDAPPGSRPPRRLAAYRKFLKSHLQTFRPAASVGGPGGPTLPRTSPGSAPRDPATELARLDFLALCEDRPLEASVKSGWAQTLRALLEAPAAPDAQALQRLDAEMLDTYHRGLVEAGVLPASPRPSDDDLRQRLRVPAP